MMKEKFTSNRRHMARTYAMQALYQWHFTQEAPELLLNEFTTDHELSKKEVDLEYFKTILLGALTHRESIDQIIASHCRRQLALLNPVELAVLRLATFELMYCIEVPRAVVLNEAIELAKQFGAVEGYKYVNGVLDALQAALR